MNIVEFNQRAKSFFTPEELEKFAEYIRESSPKLTMIDGEPFLDYSKYIEPAEFLGEELLNKLQEFALKTLKTERNVIENEIKEPNKALYKLQALASEKTT